MSDELKEREEALRSFRALWKPRSGMYHLDRNAAYEWCAKNCELVEKELARTHKSKAVTFDEVVEIAGEAILRERELSGDWPDNEETVRIAIKALAEAGYLNLKEEL